MTTTTSSSASVAIFGVSSPDFGCSCEHHSSCGSNIDYDTVVRLKKTVVESTSGGYATIIAAVWVTEGIDRCIVGRVNPAAMKHSERLEGRLCQVTDILWGTSHKAKNKYSTQHKGVVVAQIIDKYMVGDDVLNAFVERCDSDEESN
ncbi:hypothetical protein IV203_002864 [Nitzschia inconspicua]|uniref:Uncharacterized protein n=1 Tax=Nitzschia inconspicua TaxID=303405 RepID=A0A9K3L0S3_9STRA|nr:hypothetical protein IV203_002864 [Nitzschia inconspicua]